MRYHVIEDQKTGGFEGGDTIFIREGLEHMGISSTVPRICLSCGVKHIPSYEVTYFFG